jgi:hypothetical protein
MVTAKDYISVGVKFGIGSSVWPTLFEVIVLMYAGTSVP